LILSRIVFVHCNPRGSGIFREIVRGRASTVAFAKTRRGGCPVKTIMIEVPSALNGLVAGLQAVIDSVMVQVERGRAGGPVDYAAFQRDVAAKLGEVERRADETALAALDVEAPRVVINGVLHARVLRSATSYKGLAGPAVVERTLYRPVGKRNAPVVDPLALRAGTVLGEWLPATALEMAFEVQQRTSREAEASGRRLGRLPYSHASFERVAHAVGERYVGQHQRIEEALIKEFKVPVAARNVTISLDRVSLPVEEPRARPVGRPAKDAPKRPIARVFRMAYCGTVTLHDEEGEAVYTIRYGTMPDGDPEALCVGMADDAAAILSQRPDLKIALLCDGAKEMWNLLEAQFLTAPFDAQKYILTRLIDFWHVVEKLAPAAKVLAGEEAAKPLLSRWRLLLRNSSKARTTILDELIASGKDLVRVGDNRPVYEAITYLTNNAERMDYAAARRQGLPIGSGSVEATCKSLVDVRMKRPGSRWKNRTGEHTIHLRALALSDRWDDAMKHVFERPRTIIRVAA
jgi:hypothetical protein